MKLYLNTKQTFGNNIILNAVYPYYDFNEKDKLIGSKLQLVLTEKDFEKVIVKVPQSPEQLAVNLKDIVELNNLTATPYTNNLNRVAISYKADAVIKVTNSISDFFDEDKNK